MARFVNSIFHFGIRRDKKSRFCIMTIEKLKAGAKNLMKILFKARIEENRKIERERNMEWKKKQSRTTKNECIAL